MLAMKKLQNCQQWVKLLIKQSNRVVDSIHFKMRTIRKILSWAKSNNVGQGPVFLLINDQFFLMRYEKTLQIKSIRLRKIKKAASNHPV